MKIYQLYAIQNIATQEFFNDPAGQDSSKSYSTFPSYENAFHIWAKREALRDTHEVVTIVSTTHCFPTKSSDPTFDRLRFEEEEIIHRLEGLNQLLAGNKPEMISDHSWSLLNVQAAIMRSYVQVLSQRKFAYKKEI